MGRNENVATHEPPNRSEKSPKVMMIYVENEIILILALKSIRLDSNSNRTKRITICHCIPREYSRLFQQFSLEVNKLESVGGQRMFFEIQIPLVIKSRASWEIVGAYSIGLSPSFLYFTILVST